MKTLHPDSHTERENLNNNSVYQVEQPNQIYSAQLNWDDDDDEENNPEDYYRQRKLAWDIMDL